jgi:hypothetical protein
MTFRFLAVLAALHSWQAVVRGTYRLLGGKG